MSSYTRALLTRGPGESHADAQRAREARPGRISAVGWSAAGRVDYPEWAREGRRIGLICRASPWWIGDWLLYGTAKWGETYTAAARITGYDPKTLRNIRYVASRFDLSLRKDELTWSHHALLASLDRDRRRRWLERASRERLSVEDLRTELAAERNRRLRERRRGHALAGPRVRVVTCPNCGDRVPVP
jgi:hypothetical protein